MANGYAGLVRARADAPKGKRRRLDDYETPQEVTEALCEVVKFRGPILEPAAGSGRSRSSRAIGEIVPRSGSIL